MHTRSRLPLVLAVTLAALIQTQGCSTAPTAAAHLHPIASFEVRSAHTLVRGSNMIEVTQALGWPDKLGNELWVYPRVFTASPAGHDDCQSLLLVMIDGSVRDLFRANERGVALLGRELEQAKHHGRIRLATK